VWERLPAALNNGSTVLLLYLRNVGNILKVSGVRNENAGAGLKPETRHLKPMLGEVSITPDRIKRSNYKVNYEVGHRQRATNTRFIRHRRQHEKRHLAGV
jgi:hypothetical protein